MGGPRQTSAYLRPIALAAMPFGLRGSAGECRSTGQRCSRPSAPARNGCGKRGEPGPETDLAGRGEPIRFTEQMRRGEPTLVADAEESEMVWMVFGRHAAGRTVGKRFKQAARAALSEPCMVRSGRLSLSRWDSRRWRLGGLGTLGGVATKSRCSSPAPPLGSFPPRLDGGDGVRLGDTSRDPARDAARDGANDCEREPCSKAAAQQPRQGAERR